MSEKSDKPLPTQTGTPEEASSLFDRIRNLVRRLKGRNGTTLRDSLEDLIEQEEVAEGPPFQPDELALYATSSISGISPPMISACPEPTSWLSNRTLAWPS